MLTFLILDYSKIFTQPYQANFKEVCMKMKSVPVVCLAIALACGCEKKAEKVEVAPQPPAQGQVQAQPEQQAPAQPLPKGVSGFTTSLPPALAGKAVVPGGKVNLDAVNKSQPSAIITLKSEDGFNINGWAIDQKTKSAPPLVFVELAQANGGEKYYAAATRSDRGDLVKTFNAPGYKKSGYNLKGDITSLPSGEYLINIVQIADGNPILTPTGKKINKIN